MVSGKKGHYNVLVEIRGFISTVRGVTKKCCKELNLLCKTDEQDYHACAHPTKDWNEWKDEFLACCLRGRALQDDYMGDDDKLYKPGGC